MLPYPIAATQTDAKSPIDQQLMDALRLNQEYLDAQIGASSGGGILNFKVNGSLNFIRQTLSLGNGKKLDGAVVTAAITFSRARLYQKKGGLSGTTEVDVLRNINVNHPISSVIPQYQGATQSIGRLGSSQNTQSVSAATPNINTQQIVKPLAVVNIASIVPINTPNGARWLYTFTGTTLLDSNYGVGDSIEFSGATDANNDGVFVIENINYDGLPSVVVDNPSGVLQTSAAGTGSLQLFEYTFAALVDDDFVVGEEVIFAGHTDANNDGTFTIFKTNEAGNNIWIKNAVGATQGGAAGTAQCTRWVYTFASALDDTQYIVGEKIEAAGHSNANNDGKFTIRRVNEGGNNVYVTNNTGVSQGGAAGTVDTLRWLYAMGTDPSADVTAGDVVEFTGHSNALNDGNFEVKTVNRGAVNNLEVFNEDGLVQAGIAGDADSSLKIVTFEEDNSADYLADSSRVLLEGLSAEDNLIEEFDVKEVNRGVGQFNIVIQATGLTIQEGKAGRVAVEARSIFVIKPSITVEEDNKVRNFQSDDSATFVAGAVPAESFITLDVTSVQTGLPEDLTLNLS